MSKMSGLGLREGLLVIISDFFDPHGIDAMVAELKRTRHRPLLVAIGRQEDREPRLRGDIRVRDCETGEMRDVTVDSSVLDKYRDAYDQHFDRLRDFTRGRHGGFLTIDHDQDIMQQLANLFEGGRYVA